MKARIIYSLFAYDDWRSMIQGRSATISMTRWVWTHLAPQRILGGFFIINILVDIGGFLILGMAISLSINTDKFSGLHSLILAQESRFRRNFLGLYLNIATH